MSILTKVKTIKKRWYLLLVIILLVIGGSAAVHFNHEQQARTLATAKMGSQVNRQVDLDLVFLEKVSTTRITPDQAKEILPIMEKLSTATDLTTQSDLAKQVYGTLTPTQYSVLMERQNQNGQSTNEVDQENHNRRGNKGGKAVRGDKGHDFSEGNSFYGKGSLDPKEQALSSIVIKMLNDRSVEQIQPKA